MIGEKGVRGVNDGVIVYDVLLFSLVEGVVCGYVFPPLFSMEVRLCGVILPLDVAANVEVEVGALMMESLCCVGICLVTFLLSMEGVGGAYICR